MNDGDELLRVIAARRSMGLSRLKPDPVDRDLIEKMLEAANWGQSHGDTEPWRFSVFAGEGRSTLADIFAQTIEDEQAKEGARKRAFAAPVWIAIWVEPKLDDEGNLVMTMDEEIMAVATAVQNLHLMASHLGLAGMWHSKGISVDPKVAEALGIRSPSRLLGFFMCGWPNQDPPPGERGPIEAKVRWYETAPTEK